MNTKVRWWRVLCYVSPSGVRHLPEIGCFWFPQEACWGRVSLRVDIEIMASRHIWCARQCTTPQSSLRKSFSQKMLETKDWISIMRAHRHQENVWFILSVTYVEVGGGMWSESGTRWSSGIFLTASYPQRITVSFAPQLPSTPFWVYIYVAFRSSSLSTFWLFSKVFFRARLDFSDNVGVKNRKRAIRGCIAPHCNSITKLYC